MAAQVPTNLPPAFIHDPTASVHNGEMSDELTREKFTDVSLQGSVVSAIGSIITTIVTAIADVIIIIINAIVSVSTSQFDAFSPPFMVLTLYSQVLVMIWDLFIDILCCRCCTGRRRVGTRRRFGSRY